MPHPDKIEYEFGGHAHVWVKPADGRTWDDILCDGRGRPDDGWRPGKLSGHCFEERHRGSQMDGRRVYLIKAVNGYRLEEFEFGELLEHVAEPALVPA